MNLRYLFPLVILILLIIFIFSFLESSLKKETYIQEIEFKRHEIIDFMQNDPESPFKLKSDVKFEGLYFFDIDPEFRVKAKIERIPSPEPISLQMTDGETAEYFKFAIAHFSLQGVEQELILLKPKHYYDESWLFLPFYDETSAFESYGGGRFLNVEYHGEKEIYLDFNLAYNPYCAYTDTYRCPIPPLENRITVKVTAGERNYKLHH
jgi:uncharacterized protein (DUF1684 family)